MTWHRTQAAILVDAGVDLLAFETFPAQKEAEAVVQLLKELPSSRAWISFSCKVVPGFMWCADGLLWMTYWGTVRKRNALAAFRWYLANTFSFCFTNPLF